MSEKKSETHQYGSGCCRIKYASHHAASGPLQSFVDRSRRKSVGQQCAQRKNYERETNRRDESNQRTLPVPKGDEQSSAGALKPVVAIANECGLQENSGEGNDGEWDRRCRSRAEVIRRRELCEAQHWQGRVAQKARNAQLAHTEQKYEDQ